MMESLSELLVAVDAHPLLGLAVVVLLLAATVGPVLLLLRTNRQDRLVGRGVYAMAPTTRRLLEGVVPPEALLAGPRVQVLDELVQAAAHAARDKLPYRVLQMYIAGGALDLEGATLEEQAQCLLVCCVEGERLPPGAAPGAGSSAVVMAGGTPTPIAEARFLSELIAPALLPEHTTKFATPADAVPTLVDLALQYVKERAS